MSAARLGLRRLVLRLAVRGVLPWARALPVLNRIGGAA
jgi:hypothetical protein